MADRFSQTDLDDSVCQSREAERQGRAEKANDKIYSRPDRMKNCVPNRSNKALEPTPTAVTPRADARVAPAAVVAHL